MPERKVSASSADLTQESLQTRREAMFLVVAEVPAGQVVSYGDVAKLAGLGRAARLGRQDAQPVARGYPPALASGARRRRSHQPAGTVPAEANNAHACAQRVSESITIGWTYVGTAGLAASSPSKVRENF